MRKLVRVIGAIVLVNLLTLVVGQVLRRILPEYGDDESDSFARAAVMGGATLQSRAPALRLGLVNVLMGGADIDLREATLAEGATLDVFVKAGAARVVVPDDWRVELKEASLLGTNRLASTPDGELPPDAPTLRVNAANFFGALAIVTD